MSPSPPHVPRQRHLPLSKAVEIAWKQIRVRLSRSLLVTSGIVLAIAFLVSIQVNDALADGMRAWISSAPTSSWFVALRSERDRLAALPSPSDANTKRLSAVRDQLNAPRALESKLADNAVPTTPDAIAAARIQTRWLLGLALLVAFVGILNAMLMSVTERFREIGTMKCLGALDSFIVKLFLIESLFQGIAGTAVGLLLGCAVSVAMNLVTYGPHAFASLQTVPIGIALAISAGVGVLLTVAGAVWPAWQAARMHPIEAMRVEA